MAAMGSSSTSIPTLADEARYLHLFFQMTNQALSAQITARMLAVCFNYPMARYLGLENIIGESLWYVASVKDEWVALLGWGSAALKCGVRDQWIGWDRALQWRRLHLVANNVRFLMLPGWNQPNLASRVLASNVGG